MKALLIISIGVGVVLVIGGVVGVCLYFFVFKGSFGKDFISRCEAYEKTIYPGFRSTMNCTSYLNLFEEALSNEGAACQFGTFEPFVDKAVTRSMFQGKQTLLWTGTKAKIRAEALFHNNKPYIPVSRVLAGYIMNDFTVCKGGKWTEYKGCKDCDSETADRNFWKEVSKKFASLSVDPVHILIESGRNPLVNINTGILATVEVPNLDPSAVRNVHTYVYEKCGQSINQCGEASVQQLLTMIRSRLQNDASVDCKHCDGLPVVPLARRSQQSPTASWTLYY